MSEHKKSTDIQTIESYYSDIDQTTYVQNGYFKTRKEAIDRVMGIFGENAIYDRDDVRYEGKEKVRGFFTDIRALVGSHNIASINEYNGIQLSFEQTLPQQLRLNGPECKTLHVVGNFKGKIYPKSPNSEINAQGRKITLAQDADLDFKDTWVLSNGKVVYRKSDITPARRINHSGPVVHYLI